MMRKHPQFSAYLALASVCFFWGTTYLGIRMALESFPVWSLVSIRYLLSGSIMLGAARARGTRIPAGRELWMTARNGVLGLGVGNGALVLAETLIPSGLASLFVSITPFWMVAMESLVPGGDVLHLPTVLGMLIGCSGVALLIGPDIVGKGLGGNVLQAFLILQTGCCAWAAGAILQRRQPTEAHPVINGAVQQLATGVVFLIPMFFLPQHPIRWDVRGLGALVYLVVFGSIVGYSSYAYAIDRLPVALVAIYNYVNPIVAVILGWLVYREAFGLRESAAMLIIFAGVWAVKHFSGRRAAA